MDFEARLAAPEDLDSIMAIVAEAQKYLRDQGVDQWQNGYPNNARIEDDIRRSVGHVLTLDGRVVCYGVLTFGDELSYQEIFDGAWASEAPYGTLHRLATHPDARGTGATGKLLAHLEGLCRQAGNGWMRSDTHRGNAPMRGFLEKNGYHNRGVIFIREFAVGGAAGDERIAYEKQLI
ncbi:GNAT family N-acetyltransferase [Ruminococcaceae bacterium OttesenSCG-928-D13]|nr:GNAT family N-acetyltransferase [Ruminococcaceae bacterium OttesenSCG-928-D13]